MSLSDNLFLDYYLQKWKMYVIERKANSRKVSIIENYRDSRVIKKYFDLWKSKKGTVVEKKEIYADAFRERVLYIRYFHKWQEYKEQNKNNDNYFPIPFVRLYYNQWKIYIALRHEKEYNEKVVVNYYRNYKLRQYLHNLYNKMEKRRSNNELNKSYTKHFLKNHSYYSKKRFIRYLKERLELSKKINIITIKHYYLIKSKILLEWYRITQLLKNERINNEVKADKFIKKKNIIIMENVFYMWMDYYRNRICEKHKRIEAIRHYQTKIMKKILYVWKREVYKVRRNRIGKAILQGKKIRRLLQSWLKYAKLKRIEREERQKEREDLEYHYEKSLKRRCFINWKLLCVAELTSKECTEKALIIHRNLYQQKGCMLIYLYHEKEMEKEIKLFMNNEKKRIDYNEHKYALAVKYAKIWIMKSKIRRKRRNNIENDYGNVFNGEYKNVVRNSPILNHLNGYNDFYNNYNDNICQSNHPFDYHPAVRQYTPCRLSNPYKFNILPKLSRRNVAEENDDDNNEVKYDVIDEDVRKALLLLWKEKIDEYDKIQSELAKLNNKYLNDKERLRYERLKKKKREYEEWVKKKERIIYQIKRDIKSEL